MYLLKYMSDQIMSDKKIQKEVTIQLLQFLIICMSVLLGLQMFLPEIKTQMELMCREKLIPAILHEINVSFVSTKCKNSDQFFLDNLFLDQSPEYGSGEVTNNVL